MTSHTTMATAILAATALATAASPVWATPPVDVHIEVPTIFADPVASFTATGTAVDAGVICAAGSVQNVDRSATGASPAGINFHVTKEFTCDGGGTFQIKLEVRVDRKGDNFRWVIMNGTGPYEALRGSGSGVGLPLPAGSPEGVLDVYDGRAHEN